MVMIMEVLKCSSSNRTQQLQNLMLGRVEERLCVGCVLFPSPVYSWHGGGATDAFCWRMRPIEAVDSIFSFLDRAHKNANLFFFVFFTIFDFSRNPSNWSGAQRHVLIVSLLFLCLYFFKPEPHGETEPWEFLKEDVRRWTQGLRNWFRIIIIMMMMRGKQFDTFSHLPTLTWATDGYPLPFVGSQGEAQGQKTAGATLVLFPWVRCSFSAIILEMIILMFLEIYV